MTLISYIKLPLVFLCLKRCIMLDKWPPSGFGLYRIITITPPLLMTF